jgi:hypothetical protein
MSKSKTSTIRGGSPLPVEKNGAPLKKLLMSRLWRKLSWNLPEPFVLKLHNYEVFGGRIFERFAQIPSQNRINS